ncbi:MAG: class I SAM-dependent methyltransferase [Defluviitaleaceae bacterium]|nr:class I SAM-dependent methyltransferase [Defluviitaleaceae bacterium]
MQQLAFSGRLQTILKCIKNCEVLADIGTDHAYLPIEAIRAGVCKRAVACDISPGPLKIANFNIQEAELKNHIETRLGDGLKPLKKDEADCIVIAGMGGKRICEILFNSREKIKNLILQPQHDLEELRRFLHSNGYTIKNEELTREKERFYIILVAQNAKISGENQVIPWTEEEYFLGKFLLEKSRKNADITDYFRQSHKKISGYIHSVNKTSARELAEKRLSWLEEWI